MRGKVVLLLFFFPLVISCGGVKPEMVKPPSPSAPVEGKQTEGIPTDEELFNLGLSYLSSPDLNPDYPNAFLAFKKLTENYPESKWKDIAQHFIILLEKYLKLSLEISRLHMEDEALKKEKEVSNEEKIQWEEEKEGLLAEIANLKYDLECLKQIEIESEKREKNVR